MTPQQTLHELHIGQIVTSLDYSRLGRICALRDSAFAVTFAGGETKWFSDEAIFTVSGGGVTLVCNGSRFGNYQMAVGWPLSAVVPIVPIVTIVTGHPLLPAPIASLFQAPPLVFAV